MPFYRNKFKSTFLIGLLPLLVLLNTPACRQAERAAPGGGSRAAGLPGTVQPEKAGPESTVAPESAPAKDSRPVLLAFGDSLTAGYGLAPGDSYPALLQRRIDAAGYQFRVVNAGVSGDTTAGGRRRLEWSLDGDVKLAILALGGNDGLRGQPVADMKDNLADLIRQFQSRGIRVILAGMEAPPNLGPDYTRQFRQAYRDLARQYKIALIPFLLEGIGGRPELNQADGIHPNVEGEKLLVENVWRVLEPELKLELKPR
jgi:acyl-CoA thioesterase I